MRWLGGHESYQARLIKSHAREHYLILEFESEATIKDAETEEVRSINRHYLDVLELENHKVAVIRRYDL